ncbi:hypothetical protein EMPS_06524 [Entomortierella parvispora]|uniref:F-box domain-containing protein n=1 Tax=Entomortierella parvispora TaxID=205924 RepID=A0A9P3HCE4_9FUNG|nr:hypothetical protein EMPS_06524 [Entomortierella parvispora]
MDIAEIQLEVAKYLEPRDLYICTRVSREFYSVFNRELYRHVVLRSTASRGFPLHGSRYQLAASLYKHRFFIRSLSLYLQAVQIDRLLYDLENYARMFDFPAVGYNANATMAKVTDKALMGCHTRLFPNVHSMSLYVYAPQEPQLSWLVHCPNLRNLSLFVPPEAALQREITIPPIAHVLTLAEILALPLWSTTLNYLRISGSTMDYVLQTEILHHCHAGNVTELSVCPDYTTARIFKTHAEFRHSLISLNVAERTVHSWSLQSILRTFAGLERLSVSDLSVYGAMELWTWQTDMPPEVPNADWACTRLRSLHIDDLMWSSKVDVNTNFMKQFARLKDLESLEIVTMSCDDRSVSVLHRYSVSTPWNVDPCDKVLPWMRDIWPKLRTYKSGGWDRRDLALRRRQLAKINKVLKQNAAE